MLSAQHRPGRQLLGRDDGLDPTRGRREQRGRCDGDSAQQHEDEQGTPSPAQGPAPEGQVSAESIEHAPTLCTHASRRCAVGRAVDGGGGWGELALPLPQLTCSRRPESRRPSRESPVGRDQDAAAAGALEEELDDDAAELLEGEVEEEELAPASELLLEEAVEAPEVEE